MSKKQQELQIFGVKLNKYDFFHPLDVVDHNSVVEDFNKIT